MLLEKLVEIHFTQSCSCSFYHQKAKLRNLKWSHHYQLGKLRGRTHIDWDTQNVCDPENELNNNFHKEFLNRKGTRGHAEHQRHRWEGEMGEMASPPLFPVVTQLLTAPPVCITRSEQGKSCSGGNLMQPPQCLAGWDCLGMSPQGDGKCYPMAHGVSLSPPNSSAGADAEGISKKDLEVVNFCQKSERREKKWKKMGWLLKGFLGSCQFWWTLQSLHRQPCRYFTWQQSSKSTSWQSWVWEWRSSLVQLMATPQHLPTAPWETTTRVGEIFLQLLLCVTNKLVSDVFSGKVTPGVIWKSLEELLKAAVNPEKELRHCHCWSLKSYTLWTNLGLFVWGLLAVVCVTCQLGLFWAPHNENQECSLWVCSIKPWKWRDVRIVPRCVQG